MNDIVRRILLILFILAVLVYVVYSYAAGKSELDYFLVAAAMLVFFLGSTVRGLIRDLGNK